MLADLLSFLSPRDYSWKLKQTEEDHGLDLVFDFKHIVLYK